MRNCWGVTHLRQLEIHFSFNYFDLCSLCCRCKQSCHLPGSFCYGLCPEAVNHGRREEAGRWGCAQPLLGFIGTFPCLPTLPEVQRPTLNHAAPSAQGAIVLCACTQHSSAVQAHPGPPRITSTGLEMLCFIKSECAVIEGQEAS